MFCSLLDRKMRRLDVVNDKTQSAVLNASETEEITDYLESEEEELEFLDSDDDVTKVFMANIAAQETNSSQDSSSDKDCVDKFKCLPELKDLVQKCAYGGRTVRFRVKKSVCEIFSICSLHDDFD